MDNQNLKTPYIEKKPSSLRYYQESPPENLDIDKWNLEVTNLKGETTFFNYSLIKSLAQVLESRRLVCVCNWTIRRNWEGVLLSDILKAANVDVKQDIYLKQISIGNKEKGKYESTIPLKSAIERRAMLIHSVDGETLPLEQGYPLRLIDFGLYAYKGVKGLAKLIVTNEFETGLWENRPGYDKYGIIKKKRYKCVDLNQHKFISEDGEVTEF